MRIRGQAVDACLTAVSVRLIDDINDTISRSYTYVVSSNRSNLANKRGIHLVGHAGEIKRVIADAIAEAANLIKKRPKMMEIHFERRWMMMRGVRGVKIYSM